MSNALLFYMQPSITDSECRCFAIQPGIVSSMKRRGWLWRARRYGGPKWLQRRIDRIRMKSARWVLNLAEQLPQFSRGPIHRLQTIGKQDRETSTKLYNSTRPPADTSLSYDECCLFEVFPIEEFEHLESGIRRLFPRIELDSSFEDLRSSVDHLQAGGWARIGTLVRPEEYVFFPISLTEEMDLPQYVKSVEVWVHRLLPSLFAVSLHAVLDKSATQALIRVQSGHYLSDVRFWPIIPTGRRYRSATNLPDSVALRTLWAHLHRVRSEIENCFVPFLSGYFMRRPGEPPRLPALEIYQLNGTGVGARGLWSVEGEHASLVDINGFRLLEYISEAVSCFHIESILTY
jgi:hypothetical protein